MLKTQRPNGDMMWQYHSKNGLRTLANYSRSVDDPETGFVCLVPRVGNEPSPVLKLSYEDADALATWWGSQLHG